MDGPPEGAGRHIGRPVATKRRNLHARPERIESSGTKSCDPRHARRSRSGGGRLAAAPRFSRTALAAQERGKGRRAREGDVARSRGEFLRAKAKARATTGPCRCHSAHVSSRGCEEACRRAACAPAPSLRRRSGFRSRSRSARADGACSPPAPRRGSSHSSRRSSEGQATYRRVVLGSVLGRPRRPPTG